MSEQLAFWLSFAGGAGFLLASMWELVLALVILALAMFCTGDGGAPLPDLPNFSKRQVLRWFIRTMVVTMGTLIALIYLPVESQWKELDGLPKGGLVIAASVIFAILVFVLTVIARPVQRMVEWLLPDSPADSHGSRAKSTGGN